MMSLTGNVRSTAAAGTALLSVGLAASGYSAAYDALPQALGGMALVVIGATLIALSFIRTWMTDTSAERKDLADARRDADAERRKHFAAQAAFECERTRHNRGIAAERARVAATLAAEREAMRAQFEEERLQLQTEAFQTGVEMERAGALKPDAPTPANLIPFPHQQTQPERGRSREHGVVGP